MSRKCVETALCIASQSSSYNDHDNDANSKEEVCKLLARLLLAASEAYSIGD